jgi:hypothetical protein
MDAKIFFQKVALMRNALLTIYTGIITVFSSGCIIYGIRLAIRTRKENIEHTIRDTEKL